jgi:hypothetical protein
MIHHLSGTGRISVRRSGVISKVKIISDPFGRVAGHIQYAIRAGSGRKTADR